MQQKSQTEPSYLFSRNLTFTVKKESKDLYKSLQNLLDFDMPLLQAKDAKIHVGKEENIRNTHTVKENPSHMCFPFIPVIIG